jgi:bifunctional non-homologous end joining protein LigD
MNLIEMSQDIKFAKAKGGTLDKIKSEMFLDPNMVMETKYDGCRYRMVIDDGQVILQSRRISKKTGKFVEKQDRVPHLLPLLTTGFRGTIIEGEVIAGEGCDCTSSDVVSIMGCDADKAIARQEEFGKLSWVCFDMLFDCGEDIRGLPESERRKRLVNFFYHTDLEYWGVSRRYIHDLKAVYDTLLIEGYEGGMMKDTTAPYGKGWYKVKKVVDLDVVCTGFTEGKGKYAGTVGAIKFSVMCDGHYMPISQAGGMDDDTREFMAQNMKDLIGEPMSILAQEITKTKLGYSVRHPRFVRMRPDLGKADCHLDKFLEQGGFSE